MKLIINRLISKAYNEKNRTNGGGYKGGDKMLRRKLWNRMLETWTWCLGQTTNFLSIKKIDRFLLVLLLSTGTSQPLNIRTGKQKKKLETSSPTF